MAPQFNTLASAFGQVPEEDQSSIPQTNFSVEPALVDDLARLRSEQQPSESDLVNLRAQQGQQIQAHTQVAQEREQLQHAVTDRQADLELTRQFLALSDSNTPKAARAFMWKNFVKSGLGLDPKSENAVDLGRMLMGLDPSSLGNLRGAVVEASSQAQSPGAVKALLRSTVAGELPPSELFTRVADHARRRAGAHAAEVEGSFTQVSDRSNTQPHLTPGAPVALDDVEIVPELRDALGLGSERITRREAADKYGVRVTSDQGEMRKRATEINTEAGQFRTLFTEFHGLNEAIGGRPEVLGGVGASNQYLESFRAQYQGASRIIAGQTKAILQTMPVELRTADNTARINARISKIVFNLARAAHGPGVLSNQDVERFAQGLGVSGDPQQMMASMRDTIGVSYDAVRERVIAAGGPNNWQLDVTGVSDERLAQMGASPMTPATLRTHVMAEQVRRNENKAQPAEQPPERRSSLDQRDAAVVQRAEADRQRTIGQQDRTERRAEENLDLSRQGQAQQGEQFNRAEARQIEQFRESQDRATEQFERSFQRQGDWRAQDQAKAARDKLQKAFQDFAKSIGGSAPRMSVPSGGSGGSGQDPGAFRIPERRQRQAPKIPQVKRRGE